MEAKDSLNRYGQVVISSDYIRNLLQLGRNINHLNVIRDNDIDLYEQFQSELLSDITIFLDPPNEELSFDEFHKKNADVWIFPMEYQTLDVKEWLFEKCKTEEQLARVVAEYTLYEERELLMLLRFFIFFVDYMRKNKFVWGVGRGSAVSSYILYLIGIHRVDSIKYNLPIIDYLK